MEKELIRTVVMGDMHCDSIQYIGSFIPGLVHDRNEEMKKNPKRCKITITYKEEVE